MSSGGGNRRFQRGRGGGRGGGKKKSNNGSGETSTPASASKKPLTFNDVQFDVGSAKSASGHQKNTDVLIECITHSEKFGDHQNKVAKALRDKKCTAPTEPERKDDAHKNEQTAEEKTTHLWQAEQILQNDMFPADRAKCQEEVEAWENNAVAAANLLWQKCTSCLQIRIKDQEKMD